jgi:hypothetical protein
MGVPAPTNPSIDAEPRWPAIVALLAVALLNGALPESLNVGPRWLVTVIVVVLLIPTLATHHMGRRHLSRMFGYVALAVVTLSVTASLGLLVAGLSAKRETPIELLVSAVLLWLSNVLIFASWYWKLDAGGPYEREARGAHKSGAFLFPQMTMDNDLRRQMGQEHWRPGFVDYLFLAFNTSTAFSPTDAPVLSRWAKGLMMLQSGISLTTLALLAARAVNIL